ncbi:GDSL-type esterase/lipase family protein [Bradyrhizobium sp.]|uniref:GDSL-type esterase/lipase family protein n=1 Tax=Bradyrhizobium sp. TaxID=376 RepID=UPI001DA8B449|nr:GDSL-type esterase/lipase family protein [Bradyrhizobium sp.]MBI5323390.1 tetratricopeptide repeat protein [Bradyrhizobium sp.]
MRPRGDGLKLFIAILLPFVVIFGVAEVALRTARSELAFFRSVVGEVPPHVAVFRNPATRIKKFQFPVNPHTADPFLAWRNQAGLRQEPYLTTSHGIYSPHEIPYERDGKRYRLLILGDSSTAGLGIDKQSDTWPQVLQRLLGDGVEVINAAVIGYSTEQVRAALLREYYKYKPDGVLFYVGNNDGFGSSVPDRRLLDATQAGRSFASRAENWLVEHSATYVFLKAGAKYLNQIAFDTDLGDEALKLPRVPLGEFRENMDAMIRWAEGTGADVYLVIPPVPLEYPPRILEYDFRRAYEPQFGWKKGCLEPGKPLSNLLPALLNTDITAPRYPKYDLPIGRYANQVVLCFDGRLDEQRERFSKLVESGTGDPDVYNNYGYVLARSGDAQAALAAFRKAIELAPKVPHFHYNAGLTYRRLGDEQKGLAELQAAIDLDFTSARIQSPYVAELKKIAGSDGRIVLIDAAAVFRGCDNELLFADHVHPNEKGQALVARTVARTVAARRSNGAPEAKAACGE